MSRNVAPIVRRPVGPENAYLEARQTPQGPYARMGGFAPFGRMGGMGMGGNRQGSTLMHIVAAHNRRARQQRLPRSFYHSRRVGSRAVARPRPRALPLNLGYPFYPPLGQPRFHPYSSYPPRNMATSHPSGRRLRPAAPLQTPRCGSGPQPCEVPSCRYSTPQPFYARQPYWTPPDEEEEDDIFADEEEDDFTESDTEDLYDGDWSTREDDDDYDSDFESRSWPYSTYNYSATEYGNGSWNHGYSRPSPSRYSSW
ncbi:hypothetical protein M011DRAFT_295121 [Sporormia fimetaria CBS 119925]|uniref:Uncharacterized protein n=1 Tax=Sporormia fimetaria CBS 119925 TaxID=1340428 RepID=A0A6A6UV07_9PLEO|nr:hypothetical protein M011DRAFT_295121 [Sporormia fimetaria CBS 119925]